MKLCFGSFARILYLNRVRKQHNTQANLIKTLFNLSLNNGETYGELSAQTATRLLNCVDAVSPVVVSDIEKVIENGDLHFVVENFNKRIIQPNLINTEPANVAAIIYALMDVFGSDDTIDESTIINKIDNSGMNRLLKNYNHKR